MATDPAAVLLGWFDTNRRGDIEDIRRDQDLDREQVLDGLETLVDLDLVAVAPRYGAYRLTRRGRQVTKRLESAEDASLRELTEDLEPRRSIVDATAGP